ncbi:MAG: class I mannose-6-phosphate isomerase [Planctomycetes bacterium]|nr:class I mannose-6-phosphate isomerase [Planctomycetota bacterium]
MSALSHLRFQPIFREDLWGGRRLASELGKSLGAGDCYAESWEIVDHGTDQSVVVDGPRAGTTLHELVIQDGESLFGRHHPQRHFPLLFKFLDARQALSVQVHPNDEQASRIDPPDSGKTEAWVVLAAEPNSKIYAGLKPGVDRTQLERELANGTCDECLHQFEPQVGDCVLIRAGTVHALGAGLVIAEIQQASDTTYRLFDWNHVDHHGKPRPLHIQESLATIDYSRGPVGPQTPQPTDRPHVERLVECDKFVLDRWQIDGPVTLCGQNRFHLLALVQGSTTLVGGGSSHSLRRGDTILIPACCEIAAMTPQGRAVFLDMVLP